jgi:hypothetical protein
MMDKSNQEILETLKQIYRNKNLIKEVSTASPSISGGKNVKIPPSGSHAGQSGWQSGNAWDIGMSVGDPVYSVADGTVKTFADYGPKVKKVGNKKLFGAGFTVDSADGLPDVYYTHLMNPQVRKGDKVKCGQLLGFVMDFPGSSFDHLHIGIEDNNIKRFIDSSGNLNCAKGKKLTSKEFEGPQKIRKSTSSDFDDDELDGGLDLGSIGNSVVSSLTSGPGGRYSGADSFVATLAKSILGGNLKESFSYGSFGKNANKGTSKIILPSSDNSTVESPVDGIVKSTNFLGCTNELSILHEVGDEEFHLTYCGISNPSVRVGDSLSKGDKIGDTRTDIIIRAFSLTGNLLDFDYIQSKKTKKTKKEKDSETRNKKRYKSTPREYPGPPRYSNPDNFFPDLLRLPFKIISKLTEQKPTKKLDENIERIKRLL